MANASTSILERHSSSSSSVISQEIGWEVVSEMTYFVSGGT